MPAPRDMDTLLGRYDAAAIRRFMDDAGVFAALERKGFGSFDVLVETAGRALPHALLFGCKGGRRMLLLDACVGEAVVRPDFFQRRSYTMARPVELAVVHWVREEDPTAVFAADRPPLPLQRHPGLGVLRRAFRVVTRMAAERHKEGVASVPKFFHDALIFYRSRLFLFLDGDEQGCFEALARDLSPLSLGEASLALVCGCVRDTHGAVMHWRPGYQVFPLSETLTAYFHSPQYTTQVAAGLGRRRFSVDAAVLSRARDMMGASHTA